ncbi:ATP-binding cassette domain-containing protein [Clostridium botulinum]|uniref:Multidrug ABC transporter ATP-binding protein n=1 Tax=Clostridium botulinum TaxID=1491 RepID=A0A9Q1UYW4_CLOBO|nr:ATP-binding cassette domain-containing protein [Clostridium botulinum]AEB76818.1 ABC transporter related protein [Clostridium botulinum BKT015925]KEI02599.1 multidrug ABC transporter ATP-binding protein [Clostridium botulinum D str. 16868]KEI02696.1 multidrug ABC transporter ATP-binding protein [Clostridium botulinum C/D str. Sp77]KLU74747.1 multidrug ABC transporter ATP-binding protein [Clostridium botulinum V891]KOA76951.1 multidrug ABC transporter ATP-binding protein [Clostridium botulin
MSYIEISNLNKDIKGNNVLKDINLTLEKGSIYGFIGRNGSGKTMLFRAICGLIKPTTGQVFVDGKELHKDISFPESLGVTIEGPGFWDNYTGFKNLKILASIKNLITDDEIKKSIDKVGLDPEDLRAYKRYSLGMKQRLSIAQAIMEKPELIILDEPTNGLDEDGVNVVRKILLEQKKRGVTILIASHNKEDIEILADKKYKMDSGNLYKLD